MEAARKTADGRFTIEKVAGLAVSTADWVKARMRCRHLRHRPTPLAQARRAPPLLHRGNELAGRINEAFELAQAKDETGAVFVALTM